MDTVFSADVANLALLSGTFLPVVVGMITKQLSASGLKATILAALAAVAGILNGAIVADGAFTQESLMAAFATWVVAVATYYGFWKPTGVATKVADVTKSVGIGTETGSI